MKGYTGKILDINLTTREVKTRPLDEDRAKMFLGGAGYACAELIQAISADTVPLSPENVLFFMTGAMTGTMATSTGRMVCCTKSPLTGIWGESNSGSKICVQIKKAGYDGIYISGKSESPVNIIIDNEKVELKDAQEYWGKGIIETSELLLKNEEMPKGIVMAIGPAGENLVKFAMIGSEERAFGRTGLGAVMGSKNLKAILVKGSAKITPAEPKQLQEKVIATNKEMMEIFTYQMMQELGTSGSMDMYAVTGELPVKYYRGEQFDNALKISGSTLVETYLKKNRRCYACPIGCGRVVEVGENKYGLPTGLFEGPEYETLAGFGSQILNDDILQVIRLNYLCNDWGLDTISSGGMTSLMMDLVDRGKVSSADLGGIDLKWGDIDAVIALLKKIVAREGIGDILAEGPKGIIAKFNIDPEQVAAIRNSHVTFHDMRSTFPMAIAYGISPHYGGSHNSCDGYMVTTGLEIPELEISSDDPQESSVEAAIMAARLMEYRAFYSSAIMCVFANPSPNDIAKYLELTTGEPCDLDKIKVYGDRILTLKRLFNLKMGHTPKDEHIPKILLTPLPNSGQEGNVPDVDLLFREFYKYEEWDPETGKPSQAKIDRLGLNSYI